MMLAIFTVAITAGSTNLSQIVLASQEPGWKFLDPSHALAFIAMFIVLLAETGRIPVDNPATHLELTMIHEAMVLEYSGRYLALIEWGASIKQLVLMTLLANIFFPIGLAAKTTAATFGLGLLYLAGKLLVLAGVVVLVETIQCEIAPVSRAGPAERRLHPCHAGVGLHIFISITMSTSEIRNPPRT